MEQLADLVRKGLSQQNVIEDPSAIYIEEYRGAPHADIIGIALIGKLGLTEATHLACRARGGVDSAMSRIRDELKLAPGDENWLHEQHWRMNASRLVEAL